MTLQAFIQRQRIRMDDPAWVDSNPNMDQDQWARDARHFKLTLRCGRRQLTTYFSQGPAHEREPELADVLDCLASDAADVENAQSFDQWCSEYGYDTDSRKAERTYTVCQRQAEALERLIGDRSAFEELLFNTERL